MIQGGHATVIGLDYGAKRIGVARASVDLAIAQPHAVLTNDASLFQKITTLIDEEQVQQIVVGLPRNLSGEDTKQTSEVRSFVRTLRAQVSIPVTLQDEAGTSKKAQVELQARKPSAKKQRQAIATTSIDALAATYILEDFIVQGGLR